MSTAWMDVLNQNMSWMDVYKFLTKNMSTAWMDVYKFLTKIRPQPEWMSLTKYVHSLNGCL